VSFEIWSSRKFERRGNWTSTCNEHWRRNIERSRMFKILVILPDELDAVMMLPEPTITSYLANPMNSGRS